jgi:hypothetical protein
MSQVLQRRNRPPKRRACGPELVPVAQHGAEFLSRCRFTLEEFEQPVVQPALLEVQLVRVRAQAGDRVVCALAVVVPSGGLVKLRATTRACAAVVVRVGIADHACERAAPSSR